MPKTIFGTTEKSNFVLNMKDDTIDKLPLICVKLFAIVFLIGEAVPDLVENIARLTNNGMGKGYGFLNTPFICLAVVWVVSIIMITIMGLRNRFEKRYHTTIIALLSLGILWVIVSSVQSISFIDSFNGLYGRTTGVLTILSCITILLLMTFNNSEINLKSIIKVLVIVSAIQCGVGIIQILSCFVSAELSYYENLNSISLYGVCLPSGFSGSPIFFAEYLGLMLGITLTLSSFEKSKFYSIMSMVYTYLMLDTHTLVGTIGVVTIVLSVVVINLIKKNKNFLPVILCTVVAIVTILVSFVLDGTYIFYDGAIMWQDSFYRLGSTGQYWKSTAEFDINSVISVLTYLWGKAITLIKIFPFVGTGADCLIYTQFGEFDSTTYIVNGFDLVYNDYLQVAVTMGIPTLLIYVASLIFCLIKVSKRFNDSDIFKGLFVSILSFCIMSFTGITSITIMPYICIILGLACSKKFN